MNLYIKNMVCPRCIMAVRTILVSAGLTPIAVNLGEVEITEELNAEQQANLSERLAQMGFELLDDPDPSLSSRCEYASLNGYGWRVSDPNCPIISAPVCIRITAC